MEVCKKSKDFLSVIKCMVVDAGIVREKAMVVEWRDQWCCEKKITFRPSHRLGSPMVTYPGKVSADRAGRADIKNS